MAIQVAPTPQHWNYFLALEDDVARLSRYLELAAGNFDSYSLELARILFSASSEVDVVSKQLCQKLDIKSKADNIAKYRKEILLKYPELPSTIVKLPRYGLTFNPWEAWGKDKSPLWWEAYNNVKHHRHTHFSDANLKHTLNAVAGLFSLLIFFYRNEAEEGQLNPDPSLFRIGEPFQTGRLMWDHLPTAYKLIEQSATKGGGFE